MKKTTQKIVIATVMCLFSLFAGFSATVAWFSMNINTDVTGMEVRVKVMDVAFSSLTVHRCDLSSSTSSVLKFFEEPSVRVSNTGDMTVSAGLDMDNYSELSQTQPVLLLFTLEDGTYEDEIVVSATSDQTSFVSVITEDNIARFPFSSVVKFKSASYGSGPFPYDNVLISDLSTTTSFVTINDGSAIYNRYREPFHGSRHIVIKYVAIVLDYYPEAIEFIKNNSDGYALIAIHNDNAIDFYCDWMLEI